MCAVDETDIARYQEGLIKFFTVLIHKTQKCIYYVVCSEVSVEHVLVLAFSQHGLGEQYDRRCDRTCPDHHGWWTSGGIEGDRKSSGSWWGSNDYWLERARSLTEQSIAVMHWAPA